MRLLREIAEHSQEHDRSQDGAAEALQDRDDLARYIFYRVHDRNVALEQQMSSVNREWLQKISGLRCMQA